MVGLGLQHVIAIIGIGLAPVGWSMASADWTLAILTLAVAIVIGVGARVFSKLIPILIAVFVGYVVAAILGKVDFSNIVAAPWVALPSFVFPTISIQAMSLIAPVVVMLVAENLGHVRRTLSSTTCRARASLNWLTCRASGRARPKVWCRLLAAGSRAPEPGRQNQSGGDEGSGGV
jgi:xanthine/uracil permease